MEEIIALLPYVIPNVLVAIVAFALSGVFFQQARLPAILAMVFGVLTLLQAGFILFSQVVLFELLMDDILDSTTYGLINTGIHTTLYLAISAIMLFAAFSGRGQGFQAQPAHHGQPAPASGQLQPHRGGLVLTLGLLGILVFAPVGIVAWILGSKDLNAMRAGTMDPTGEGTTLAGKVLGILATVLMVLGIILAIGIIAVVATSYRGF
ncbi:MAG: hypothetical protein MI745_03425 [Pseudomonadales bacterium]|nr:hypothetical protein [Pseudomonadales bacterium]